MTFAENLNEKQLQAVEHTEGPLLILAGAGSGKTKTLTHRIARLIEEGLANQWQILAVTFTNKAAGEMRARVAGLCGEDPNNRSFMPFLGTFHSICVRILRMEAENIGLNRQFVIFDSGDQLQAIKQVMRQRHIDEKRYNPNAIRGLISSAKNELVDSETYKSLTSGDLQEVAAEVYPLYQRLLKEAEALDFDDLLFKTVRMLETHPEILKRWQDKFRYIMIDEYQDTNHAQYQFAKLLAANHNNLCVVGDDWQCLLPGSLIETEQGLKKIEEITKGERVRSVSGYGKTGLFEVTKRKTFDFKGEMIQITTASGQTLTTTPNHILFSRWGESQNYFVYLMFSSEKGYRIGIAKGTRFDGKKSDIGLRVRANQERADRMWVLEVCSSREEALYREAFYAYQYGIPMMVFHAYSNRSMQISQEYIDRLYGAIDTKERAVQLMRDLKLSFDYPHFMPQATSRSGRKKLNLNLVLFGDKRTTQKSPYSASRLSMNTTDKSGLSAFEVAGYRVRAGRAETFRVEAHNLDYGQLETTAEKIVSESKQSLNLCRYAFITERKMSFTPASHIRPGMLLPVVNGDEVIEDEVIAVESVSYNGPVYDLDVDKVHNYTAAGIVVHNSIYSWRGANFRNILDFERDYPDALVVKLEQNYRSTQSILTAAQAVIAKNQVRSKKELWTDGDSGVPVKVEQAANEMAEAEIIMRYVKATHRPLSDIAVLYRTNAQSRALEDMCIRYGVAYQIIGGVRFYERKEIKDVLAYLRLCFQSNDQVSFERVINLPPRGIGAKSLQQFFDWQREQGLLLGEALMRVNECEVLSARAINSFQTFGQMIERAREHEFAPADLIEHILSKSGYLDYINDGTIQSAERIENVQELVSVAKEFSALDVFLEEVALIADVDGMKDSHGGITLMTLHAAKGLEFPVVFIVGLEEGVFPHSRSIFDPEQMEEERRLMYVGMTRAMEELHLLHSRSRMLFGSTSSNPPARFLSEIDAETVASGDEVTQATAPSLDTDDTVRHPVFGTGIVVAVEGDEVIVAFQRIGNKKLSLTYAPLEKL